MKSLHLNYVLLIALLTWLISLSTIGAVEIVVQASRIEEDSQEVPASVTIIDEEDLGYSPTVLDALSKVTDLVIVTTTPGDSSITMSGFGENGHSRVLILIDGVPINRPDLSSFNWESIPLARVSLKDFTLFASYLRVDNNTSRDRTDNRNWNVTVAPSYSRGPFTFTSNFYFTPSKLPMADSFTKADYDDDPDQATNQNDFVEAESYDFRTNTAQELGNWQIKLPFSMMWMDKQVDLWGAYTDSKLSELSFLPSVSFDIWFDSKARDNQTLDANISRSTISLWGLVKYSLNDKINLSAGARYSFSVLEAESTQGLMKMQTLGLCSQCIT